MTDNNPAVTKPKLNKTKIYVAALIIFLLVNFGIETGVTLLENSTGQWLYPIFPFTRIGLLILTILATNYYIRRRAVKPKPKLWWRIVKPILLILVTYGLIMGAWLSVSNADADRAAAKVDAARQPLPTLPEPPVLTSPNDAGASSIQ
jgi:hypothetical protein